MNRKRADNLSLILSFLLFTIHVPCSLILCFFYSTFYCAYSAECDSFFAKRFCCFKIVSIFVSGFRILFSPWKIFVYWPETKFFDEDPSHQRKNNFITSKAALAGFLFYGIFRYGPILLLQNQCVNECILIKQRMKRITQLFVLHLYNLEKVEELFQYTTLDEFIEYAWIEKMQNTNENCSVITNCNKFINSTIKWNFHFYWIGCSIEIVKYYVELESLNK